MSWLSPSDFQTHLSLEVLTQLSTGNGRATTPDDTVLQACLDHAQGQVQGLLAGRAAFDPNTDPGGLLHDICLHLAIESLFLRQPGEAAKLPEGWQVAVKEAHHQLQAMVEGDLPIPNQVQPTRLFAALNPRSPVDRAFRDLLP